MLSSWQNESAKVTIFQCPFERWEYNKAFGPGRRHSAQQEQGRAELPEAGQRQLPDHEVDLAGHASAGDAGAAKATGS